MSHVTSINLVVKDLDSLEKACDELGLELQRGKRTYAWWGQFMNDSNAYGGHDPKTFGRGEHAIKVKGDRPQNGSMGPWEIGVVKALDNKEGFELLYDQFGGAGARLTEKVGPAANKLRQQYAAAVAEKNALAKLSRHGYRASRETLPTGALRLRLRKR